MGYLRRNYVPLLIGVWVTLFAIAVGLGVDDLLNDGGGHGGGEQTSQPAAAEADGETDGRGESLRELLESLGLGDLPKALEGLDMEDLQGVLGPALRELSARFGSVLGVTLEEGDGAPVVRSVVPGTPADEAGVEPGDEIVSVDGRRVGSTKELREALANVEPGTEYQLRVRRDGRTRTLDVERRPAGVDAIRRLLQALAERFGGPGEEVARPAFPRETPRPLPAPPSVPQGAQLGVNVVQTTEGLRVVAVSPGSGAADAGVRPGDVIVAVGDTRVSSIDELRAKIARRAPGETVALTILRDGERHSMRLRLSGPADQLRRERDGDGVGPRLEPPAEQGLQQLPPQLQQLLEQLLRERAGADAPRAPDEPLPQLQQLLEQLLGRPLDGAGAASGGIEALLDRLADMVAQRLEARGGLRDARPVEQPREAPPRQDAPAAGLKVYFGRVAEIGGGSITLTGSLGPVTLRLTDDTEVIGAVEPRPGVLVTAVTHERTVTLLVVIE